MSDLAGRGISIPRGIGEATADARKRTSVREQALPIPGDRPSFALTHDWYGQVASSAQVSDPVTIYSVPWIAFRGPVTLFALSLWGLPNVAELRVVLDAPTLAGGTTVARLITADTPLHAGSVSAMDMYIASVPEVTIGPYRRITFEASTLYGTDYYAQAFFWGYGGGHLPPTAVGLGYINS